MKSKEIEMLYLLLEEMAKTDLSGQVMMIKKVYRGITIRNFKGRKQKYFLNKLDNRLFELGYTNRFCGYRSRKRNKRFYRTT